MVDAVRKVAPEFEGIVEWREHKIKYRESLIFMTSLMVRNVPTICIDGQIVFVSRIPPHHELVAAIQKRINEKMRLRIEQKQATLLLGEPGAEAQRVLANIQQAVQELGAHAAVESVEDPDTMRSYGVCPTQTPAVVLVNREAFLEVLRRLDRRVLRLKGHVRFAEGFRFVEVVHDRITEKQPSSALGSATRFTVIGWQIDREALIRSFEACWQTP